MFSNTKSSPKLTIVYLDTHSYQLSPTVSSTLFVSNSSFAPTVSHAPSVDTDPNIPSPASHTNSPSISCSRVPSSGPAFIPITDLYIDLPISALVTNQHSMITRSKTGSLSLRTFMAHLTNISEPQTTKQAHALPQ